MASEARRGASATPSEDVDGKLSTTTPCRAPAEEVKDQDTPDVLTLTHTATVPTSRASMD